MNSVFKKNKEFTEIFDRHYANAYSTICAKVSDPDDAEDICQQVFIKMFHKLESIENPRKWLFGAIRLEVLAYYKKKGDKNVNIDEVFNDSALEFVNGFRDSRILLKEILEDDSVYEDDTEKDLVDLVSVHKFTYEEAGRLLGLSKRQARYKYGIVVNKILDFLAKKGIKSFEDLL